MTGAGSDGVLPNGMSRAVDLLHGRRKSPMEVALELNLVEIGEGFAVFAGTPGQNVLNPMGMAHGGYTATILDSACGIALLTTLAEGQKFATLELKVAYHKAVSGQSAPVRAEGKVLTRGRQIAFTEARLFDTAGQLLASATSTLVIQAA